MSYQTKALLTLFFCCGAQAQVSPEQCITLQNDVGKAMLITMLEDLGINRDIILEEKTEIELVSRAPVNHALALTYGETEKKLSGKNSDDPTTAEEYAQGFMENNARHLLVKYTFENAAHQQNVLLASAFVNDRDCAVRFNNYLIVSREF